MVYVFDKIHDFAPSTKEIIETSPFVQKFISEKKKIPSVIAWDRLYCALFQPRDSQLLLKYIQKPQNKNKFLLPYILKKMEQEPDKTISIEISGNKYEIQNQGKKITMQDDVFCNEALNDIIINGSPITDYSVVAIGTGTGTPSPVDTTMFTHVVRLDVKDPTNGTIEKKELEYTVNFNFISSLIPNNTYKEFGLFNNLDINNDKMAIHSLIGNSSYYIDTAGGGFDILGSMITTFCAS